METLEVITKKYSEYSTQQLLELVAEMQLKVDQLTQALYSKKSEKWSKEPYVDPNQRFLFNDVEQAYDEYEKEYEVDDRQEASKKSDSKPSRRRGKRTKLSKDLPREKQYLDLPDDKKTCPTHGVELEKVGENTSEKIQIIPEQIKVIETTIPRYKCPCCDNEDADKAFSSATPKKDLLPKTIATPSLLAYLITRKYQDGLPLYRLEALLSRHGIDISRTTMSRWMIQTCYKLGAMKNLLTEDLLSQTHISCDETVVQVLKEPGRSAESQSYMWVTTGLNGPPIRLFQYDPGRSESTANKILDGFEGVLLCDGLKTYSALEKKSGNKIIRAACLSHIRRKFYQADKALKKANSKKIPKTKKPLDFIRALYAIEKKISSSSFEDRLKIRSQESEPILKELGDWCREQKQKVLPKSLLGKAIQYTLDQWEPLQTFLSHPQIPIDNNVTERAIRPFVIGRKNWLFSQTTKGAEASALFYSIIETAKACSIEPYYYLIHLFKELPYADSLEDLEKLLPYKIPQEVNLPAYKPKG